MEMKRYKLGEIGEIRMCKRILKEETNSVGGVPFFKIGTFGGQADVFITKEKFEEYKNAYSYPKKGDVLISAAGTIGRTVVFDGKDAYFQDSNIVWIENDESKVLNEYLFYCYKNIRWTTSVGSAILRLYNDDIRNTDIIVPPLSEQKKIASVLSALDDKIALNKKMNQKLEAMAKRLYDYWFVQYDFPDKNGRPYKTTGGPMTYNPTLKREIPVGWEVDNLYAVADYINGLACQNNRPKSGENALPVIKIREMSEGITSDTEEVSENIPSKYIVENGDILFSWSATLLVMIWAGGKGGLNQHIFRVAPKESFPKEFVYQLLSDYVVNFQQIALSRKTTMGHITSDHINLSRVVLPPESVLKIYAEKVRPIFDKIVRNQVEFRKLTALRDKLLPLLMNGQVVVG